MVSWQIYGAVLGLPIRLGKGSSENSFRYVGPKLHSFLSQIDEPRQRIVLVLAFGNRRLLFLLTGARDKRLHVSLRWTAIVLISVFSNRNFQIKLRQKNLSLLLYSILEILKPIRGWEISFGVRNLIGYSVWPTETVQEAELKW